MFVVAPDTVLNPSALETRAIPRRILGRVALWPRRGADLALWARLAFEIQILRYLVALAPFVVAMLIWRDLALPIAQAPLVMVIVIGLVEIRFLTVAREQRAALLDDAEAARRLDALRLRALRILTRVAARHGLREGEIALVVEQSELARVTPLTLVSVQRADPPEVMRLAPEDRDDIRGTLFDEALTERALHVANQREDAFLREVRLDARGVSAHARMAALAAARAAAPAAATARAAE